jgi:hypothetical protein
MGTNDIARATRRQKRQRTLGTAAACEACGWTDPTALTKKDGRVLCYECRCQAAGKPTSEAHHHLGRAVDPATIPILGNIHRDLSDRQRDWPAAVRSNPQRDPLLWLAAALLGLRDHLGWWTAWLDRVATFLTQLGASLVEQHGECWWETIDVVPVWQRTTS